MWKFRLYGRKKAKFCVRLHKIFSMRKKIAENEKFKSIELDFVVLIAHPQLNELSLVIKICSAINKIVKYTSRIYRCRFTMVKYGFLFSNYDNEDTTFMLLFLTSK